MLQRKKRQQEKKKKKEEKKKSFEQQKHWWHDITWTSSDSIQSQRKTTNLDAFKAKLVTAFQSTDFLLLVQLRQTNGASRRLRHHQHLQPNFVLKKTLKNKKTAKIFFIYPYFLVKRGPLHALCVCCLRRVLFFVLFLFCFFVFNVFFLKKKKK